MHCIISFVFFKGGEESCKWVGKEVKEVFFAASLTSCCFPFFLAKRVLAVGARFQAITRSKRRRVRRG